MNIETEMIGQHVFFAVLDDNDEDWEVVEGVVYGVIVDIEVKRSTWVQYKINTNNGPHVISEDYVYAHKPGAEQRCEMLNKVKL